MQAKAWLDVREPPCPGWQFFFRTTASRETGIVWATRRSWHAERCLSDPPMYGRKPGSSHAPPVVSLAIAISLVINQTIKDGHPA